MTIPKPRPEPAEPPLKEPVVPQPSDAYADEEDEDNELEDAVETAIEKAAQKHHMRDGTVMLLSVLGLLCAAGGIYVPFELHKRQAQLIQAQTEERIMREAMHEREIEKRGREA